MSEPLPRAEPAVTPPRPTKPLKLSRGLTLLLVAGAVIWGLYWRVHLLDAPFIHGHLGNGASHIATFVRNLYRYGPATTKLASVENQGKASPETFRFAPNHPPLTHLYYAPFWALAPGKEWTLRATALLFAIVSWIVLLRLALRSSDRRFALVLLGIGAILPMGAYYDVQVDVQGPDILAISLLMLLAYIRWLERPLARRWLLVLGLFVLGSASEWPIYYMAAAVIADLVLFRPSRRPVTRALSLVVVALTAFLLYSAYVAVLQGGDSVIAGLQRLEHGASNRSTFSLPEAIRRAGPGGMELFWHYLRGTMHNVVGLFTVAALALSALAIGEICVRAIRGSLTLADRLLVMLLVFGSLHVLLFAGGAAVHDYWWKYLLPAVAWATARGLMTTGPAVLALLGRNIEKRRREWLGRVLSVTILMLLIGPSAAKTVEMYGIADPTTWERGTCAAEATRFDQVVLAPDLRADPVLQYYMDREFVPRVSTPAKLAEALETYGKRAALMTIHRRDLEKPALAPLLMVLARYPFFERYGHRFYRLRAEQDGG